MISVQAVNRIAAEKQQRFPDSCEWNPETGEAAHEDEVHAAAEWIVGADGQWRLCDSCANLPEFKRYRRRMRIERKGGM